MSEETIVKRGVMRFTRREHAECAAADERLVAVIKRHEGNAMTAETLELIRGAVARGWCSKANSHKEMDSTLALAIADEVLAALGAQEPVGVTDDYGNPMAFRNGDNEGSFPPRTKLYTTPVPVLPPEGWQMVPKMLDSNMLRALQLAASHSEGWTAALAAAPECKL